MNLFVPEPLADLRWNAQTGRFHRLVPVGLYVSAILLCMAIVATGIVQ